MALYGPRAFVSAFAPEGIGEKVSSTTCFMGLGANGNDEVLETRIFFCNYSLFCP